MEFIINNWYVVLAILALAAVGGVLAYKFFKQPTSKQVAKVKKWLLVAVQEAEERFGAGTGQTKLRWVYDMFTAKFPWLAKIVTFETFSGWVDEALDTVEEWLKDDAVAEK